jgi:hypothetical protein
MDRLLFLVQVLLGHADPDSGSLQTIARWPVFCSRCSRCRVIKEFRSPNAMGIMDDTFLSGAGRWFFASDRHLT